MHWNSTALCGRPQNPLLFKQRKHHSQNVPGALCILVTSVANGEGLKTNLYPWGNSCWGSIFLPTKQTDPLQKVPFYFQGLKKKTDSGHNFLTDLNRDTLFFNIYLPNNKVQISFFHCVILFRWESINLIRLDLSLCELLCFCLMSGGIASLHHHIQLTTL